MPVSRTFLWCLAAAVVVCGCSGAPAPTPAPAADAVLPVPAVVPPDRPPVPDRPAAGPVVVARPLPGLVPASATAGCAPPVVHAYETTDDLGGLSGIARGDGPGEFVVISDAGGVFSLAFDDSGARLVPRGLLAGLETGTNADRDAEALARLPDGRWIVSFERTHRLAVFPSGLGGLVGGPASVVGVPADWRALPANQGVESLALGGDGRLVAIAEGSPLQVGDRPVWWFSPPDGPQIQALAATYRTGFGVTPGDAAGGPDGQVYVLERQLDTGGLTARIVRVVAAGDGRLGPQATLDLSGMVPAANYEGMTIDPAFADGLRFILVSDGDGAAPSVIVDLVVRSCAFLTAD